jgi:hypothetical protein
MSPDEADVVADMLQRHAAHARTAGLTPAPLYNLDDDA